MSFALVWSCGIYADIAMMGEPSCGMSVSAETYSPICDGAGITVTTLYVSRLAASMVPPDLLFVVGSRVGGVWISL